MSGIDDGGPAFPFEHGHSPDAANVREIGMSLRDHFAGQALAGLLADPAVKVNGKTRERIAAGCYAMSDAMLTARAAGKEQPE